MECRIGLQQKLLAAVDEYDMLATGQRVLVAVSGGPDSMALLHALYTLADSLEVQLAVAHLNHGLRGAAADDDERYVHGWSQRWDLPYFVEHQDIAALAAEEKLSIEQAGRQARYEFFTRLAAQHGFDRIALGHTATDRIETLLINLLRGTGLHGLRSIPPCQGQFIRPLITARREETAEYCAVHNLQPRLDASNLSAEYCLRNKVRLELLPRLASDYAPHIATSLLRLAAAVEQELQWTEPLVEAAYRQAAQADGDGIALDLHQLADMPEGLRYRLLRYALVQLRADTADMEAVHYDALHRMVRSGQTGRQVALPGGVLAQRGYNSIRLTGRRTEEQGACAGICDRHTLAVPGTVRVPELGLTVEAEVMRQRPAELGQAQGRQIVMDGCALGDKLFVRTWQPGDRLQPLGMTGHKKVQDIFVDEKVPRRQRARVPLLTTSDDEIVWAVGYCLSEQFKVTGRTERYVRLTVGRDEAAVESEN